MRVYRRKTIRKNQLRFNNLFLLSLCQPHLTCLTPILLQAWFSSKCSGDKIWIWACLNRCTIPLNLEVQTRSMHIPTCKCKDSLKWWCPSRLIPNKCSPISSLLVVHTLETRAAHASTQGDLLVDSKIISEVALTVETTSIIIMVEATKDQAVLAPNSTHRSSRLSSAVTLCSRELALS